MKFPTLHQLYRWWDAQDNLLYIGRSINAFVRAAGHRGNADWYADAVKMTVETVGNHYKLCKAEARAIATEHPKYNVQNRVRPNVQSTPSPIQVVEKFEFFDPARQKSAAVKLMEEACRDSTAYCVNARVIAKAAGIKPKDLLMALENEKGFPAPRQVLPSTWLFLTTEVNDYMKRHAGRCQGTPK